MSYERYKIEPIPTHVDGVPLFSAVVETGDGYGDPARERISFSAVDGRPQTSLSRYKFADRVAFRWRDDLDGFRLVEPEDENGPRWRVSCMSNPDTLEDDRDAGELIRVDGFEPGSFEAAIAWLKGADLEPLEDDE